MPDMSIFRRGVTVHDRPGKGGKRASCSAETFIERGAELVERQDVREVMLSFLTDQVEALTTIPAFRALEAVKLLSPVTDEDAALIGRTPFQALRELVIEDSELTADGVKGLLAGDLPRQLVRLDLSGSALGDAGIAVVARVPLPKLESLRLHRCRIRGPGTEEFARTAQLPALNELDLGGPPFTMTRGGGNVIGPDGAEALARAGFMRQLQELRLQGNGMEDRGAIALAAVPMPVRHVDLSWNSIGDQGATALARAPWPHLGRIGLMQGNNLVHHRDTRDVYDSANPLQSMGTESRPLVAEEIQARYGFAAVY